MSSPNVPNFSVVGLGGSAGGIKALLQFFTAMPADSGMAFVVILHLSDEHDSTLAQILQTKTRMPVMQVNETVTVEPDHVYVIPPAKHLAMVDGAIQLTPPERIRGRRVPIDLFFRTLADAYGTNGVAVILSGTGSDGTLGLKRVKECGGLVLAQNPEEAEFGEMPTSAIATKLVDIVLPVDAMPERLLAVREIGQKLRTARAPSPESDRETEAETNTLREILTLVRIRTGHDFTNYKRPTVQRRIARRLQVRQLTELPAYLTLLRDTPEEVHALLQDLLITVTNFFRDRETFAVIEREIIPNLFANKDGDGAIRIWVPGCATGEEAYSLAMLLAEHAATRPDPPKFQIFASDINEEAIRSAREGRYDELIAGDVGADRLQRFFVRESGGYRIKKEIRESVLFAPHNLLRDPPFSRLDMVSCRNLLIYLSRETQERVLELFHFALRPEGRLLLGSSESAETLSTLFTPVDKKHRLYQSRASSGPYALPLLPTQGRWEVRLPELPLTSEEPRAAPATIHYQLLEQYAPPSVLLTQDFEIIHASESAGRYLRFAGGEPTRNLLQVVHPALQFDIRALLLAAKKEHRQVEVRNIQTNLEGTERRVSLRVRAIKVSEAQEFFLVIFDESDEASPPASESRSVAEMLTGDKALEVVVRRLEEELQQTRERLRTTLEQSEVSSEEMRASNEELQAINEELRSASEELETSKEELHSVNEELTTVNHELKEKVAEVSSANSDLQNLMAATDLAIVFLDRALHIKRYTPRTAELFNIIPSDIGRPLEHLTHKLEYAGFSDDAAAVLQSLRAIERETRGANHRNYLVRFTPYRTMEDRIDGVVLSFIDVTELYGAYEQVREHERLLRLAQQAAKAGIWTLHWREGTAWWSDECFLLHNQPAGSSPMTVENWFARLHPLDRAGAEAAMCQAILHRTEYNRELRLVLPDGAERWLLEVGRATYDERGQVVEITGITLDITDRVAWREEQCRLLSEKAEREEALYIADRNKSEFLAMLAHELRNPLAPIISGLEILNGAANPQEAAEARSVIQRQFQQIVHLVDDLLDIARIDQGKIQLRKRRFDLAEAIHLAVETTQPLIDRHRHLLSVRLAPQRLIVDADETRLAQAFQNILNNAAKYCAPGSEITVTLRQDGDWAVVSLVDNGCGIPPHLLPKIFDMFVQGEAREERAQSGMGIGLTVVKRMVEMHGGTITVQSSADEGSKFVIRLPLAGDQRAPSEEAAADLSEAPPSAPRRILVIDDNIDGATTLRVLLSRHGHTVECAHDGRSGLAAAEKFTPDVVLLDIGLPDMDGHQVARELRKKFSTTLLIAVSGWGQEEDRHLSREAGFNHHLVKPIEVRGILRLLALAGDSRS